MLATAKANRESKEVYLKSRVNSSDKNPYFLLKEPVFTERELRREGTICIIHNFKAQ